MKHGEGKDIARELYIYQQCTFDEIAKRIGRSDKTIREWAIAENWRDQRDKMMKSKIQVHEKLYALINKVADRMISDCDTDQPMSPQTIHGLTNLISAMNSSYKYEASTDKVEPDQEKQDTSPEALAAKVRELLGA